MTYRGRRVVAFTPYGRERTVSVLLHYLRREHEAGVLDEWMLDMNTNPQGQERDVAYANELAGQYDWINLYPRPGSGQWTGEFPIPDAWYQGARHPVQLNSHQWFAYMTDRNTVYVRFDDDIIYVHEDAIRRMVDSAIDRPEVLTTFPIIINNAVVSWHLQQQGRVPHTFGTVESAYCIDQTGWASPFFAEGLHRMTLDLIKNNAVDQLYLYTPVQLPPTLQFSISCFAIRGAEFADVRGVVDLDNEELWLTTHRPAQIGKFNAILPDALVSHYTFHSHRAYIETTDILDQYRALAEKLT